MDEERTLGSIGLEPGRDGGGAEEEAEDEPAAAPSRGSSGKRGTRARGEAEPFERISANASLPGLRPVDPAVDEWPLWRSEGPSGIARRRENDGVHGTTAPVGQPGAPVELRVTPTPAERLGGHGASRTAGSGPMPTP